MFHFCLLFAQRDGVTQTHTTAGRGHGAPPSPAGAPLCFTPPLGQVAAGQSRQLTWHKTNCSAEVTEKMVVSNQIPAWGDHVAS